jgi:hypothetical protein
VSRVRADYVRGLALVAWVFSALMPIALAPTALAHRAPSLDENNRYLKLTPMAGRMRLAYTVYFGEVPGGQGRRRIDRNGDGTIDESEARAHGADVAREITPNLHVIVDGVVVPWAWAEIHVGLGVPTTDAGSYAIDLIAWICFPSQDRHDVVLRDRVLLANVGETEIKVEGSPGISVERAALGDGASQSDLRLRGASPALADPGYQLVYRVNDAVAMRPMDGKCPEDESEGGGTRDTRNAGSRAGLWMIGVGGLFGLGLVLTVMLAKRRRRGLGNADDSAASESPRGS